MWYIMRFLGPCVFVMLACTGVAKADEFSLFVPMSGFSLLEPTYPAPPGGPVAYSQTDGALEWSVGPWGSPGGRMPPFKATQDGQGNSIFSTHSAGAGVIVTRGLAGTTLDLEQNGQMLACNDAAGHPQEFDLFAEPNGAGVKSPRLAGLFPAGFSKQPLSTLSHLYLSANVTMQESLADSRKHCQVNIANTQFSVILINDVSEPNQVFFYQLLFSRFCGAAPTIKLNSCGMEKKKIEQYSPKNPYGADDFLPLLGMAWLEKGQKTSIQADLLPRLKQAISTGPAGLDKDITHWHIGSVYLGQIIYGDLTLRSSWRDVSLLAETN